MVTSLETDAFVAIVACCRQADGKSYLSARSKRRYSRWKKRPRLRISRLRSNVLYSAESWRIGIERFGGQHLKFSGCTWYTLNSGRKKGNLEALSKKVNLMSEILARPGRRNNHLREPHEKQIVPAMKRGIWARKYASMSRTLNYVLFSCEGARDIEARMFIVYSGASLHNAEPGELSSDTMDTLRRSKTP